MQRAYNPDTGGGVWLPILELWKTTNARRTKISIPAHKAKAASCDIIPQYVATWLEVYKLVFSSLAVDYEDGIYTYKLFFGRASLA